MLRLIYQSKGANNMALISDAIGPAGRGDGDFQVWGERIIVRDGKTSLGTSEGTIAGSVITMRDALENIISLGTPAEEAIRMASLVPARIAGIERHYGSIENGKRADLIVLDDDLRVRMAILGGAIALDAG